MNNYIRMSTAEVFLWDTVPEMRLLDQRVNTFMILTDTVWSNCLHWKVTCIPISNE